MFIIWGKVLEGKKRGKALGFPTANINLSRSIPHGVYISLTKVQNRNYPSLTFIGNATTFNDSMVGAETYILFFNASIYNQWISIQLIRKIRGNKKFDSKEQLIEQMQKDRQKAKEHFNNETI